MNEYEKLEASIDVAMDRLDDVINCMERIEQSNDRMTWFYAMLMAWSLFTFIFFTVLLLKGL